MKDIVYTQMMIELLQRIQELEEEIDQLKSLLNADKVNVNNSVKTVPLDQYFVEDLNSFDKPCVTSSINKYGKSIKVE